MTKDKEHKVGEYIPMPKQEPVGKFAKFTDGIWREVTDGSAGVPLYIAPQRIWVGLTPQERDEINEQVYGAVPHHVAFHAAIEAKLKEKNT
jgi:hypothetical protein